MLRASGTGAGHVSVRVKWDSDGCVQRPTPARAGCAAERQRAPRLAASRNSRNGLATGPAHAKISRRQSLSRHRAGSSRKPSAAAAGAGRSAQRTLHDSDTYESPSPPASRRALGAGCSHAAGAFHCDMLLGPFPSRRAQSSPPAAPPRARLPPRFAFSRAGSGLALRARPEFRPLPARRVDPVTRIYRSARGPGPGFDPSLLTAPPRLSGAKRARTRVWTGGGGDGCEPPPRSRSSPRAGRPHPLAVSWHSARHVTLGTRPPFTSPLDLRPAGQSVT